MTELLALFLFAHSWYPYSCCGVSHCQEVNCASIARVPGAYRFYGQPWELRGDYVDSTHDYSQDGKCHLCVHGKVRCIFTPLPAGT